MTYTVQYSQYGMTETVDFETEADAREIYAEIVATDETTHAWLFDGIGQHVECLAEFVRPL